MEIIYQNMFIKINITKKYMVNNQKFYWKYCDISLLNVFIVCLLSVSLMG